MDGRNTFIKMEMEDMYFPIVKKVQQLTKHIDKQFKDYNIRGFTVERRRENLFLDMKLLAFKKYRKLHIIPIIRKTYINIFDKNEIDRIRRPRSHGLPYHKRTYNTIILRNFNNFKYNPYLFPLSKEDTSNKLFLNQTDIKKKRKKIKQKIYLNPHIEMKIKYLTKINKQLKEKHTIEHLEKNHIIQKRKSNPSLSYNLSYNQYLVNNYNNQRKRIQGIRSQKMIYNNLNNQSLNNEGSTNYKSQFKKSINFKKEKHLILPKIKAECVSTIKDLNKINRKLRVFKGGDKDNKPKEEINDDNLLNLNLPQLYRLFYIKNKKKNKFQFKKTNQKEIINKNDQAKNNNLTIQEKPEIDINYKNGEKN